MIQINWLINIFVVLLEVQNIVTVEEEIEMTTGYFIAINF